MSDTSVHYPPRVETILSATGRELVVWHIGNIEKTPLLPGEWEIVWRVRLVASRETGIGFDRITVDSRLLEDLGMDSLALLGFIMALEDEFEIDISDETIKEFFTKAPSTIYGIAMLVIELWGTGKPERDEWLGKRPELPLAEEAPFTQLGPEGDKGSTGPLFESLGLNREGYSEYRRTSDGMRCVLIPAGLATLGSDALDAPADQLPAHSAALSAFLMDAEPVSNAAYARFLNSIGPVPTHVIAEWCGADGKDNRANQFSLIKGRRGWLPVQGTEQQPMILVSWFGANAYSLWAHRCDSRYYHRDGPVAESESDFAPPPPEWEFSFLPSEAQWEYAAGTVVDESARVARHVAGTSYQADTLPVSRVSERLGMSPFGLHHMSGNVWQWCRDWYVPDFYRRPEAVLADPENRTPSGIRSERGGSWVGPARLSEPSYRRGRPPEVRGRCLGFRCCAPGCNSW